MPNLPVRLLLFVSSYAPLLIILWVRNLFQPFVSGTLLAVAVISVIVLLSYLWTARRFSSHNVTIQSANGCSHEAISYIVTYLLPFLGLDSGSLPDRVSLALVLLVIAVLYVGANLIHMNPVLNLLGYHVFEIDTTEGKHAVLLSRRRYIRANTTLRAVSLANTILLEIP